MEKIKTESDLTVLDSLSCEEIVSYLKSKYTEDGVLNQFSTDDLLYHISGEVFIATDEKDTICILKQSSALDDTLDVVGYCDIYRSDTVSRLRDLVRDKGWYYLHEYLSTC